MEPHLPAMFYWTVGMLVATNIGTIGAVLYFGGKVVWWASSVDTRLTAAEDEIDTLRALALESR